MVSRAGVCESGRGRNRHFQDSHFDMREMVGVEGKKPEIATLDGTLRGRSPVCFPSFLQPKPNVKVE